MLRCTIGVVPRVLVIPTASPTHVGWFGSPFSTNGLSAHPWLLAVGLGKAPLLSRFYEMLPARGARDTERERESHAPFPLIGPQTSKQCNILEA